MSKESINADLVNWELFDALYESQADFCRKLRFLVKSGRATEEGELALDIISDQLNFREKEMTGLREQALIQSRRIRELWEQGNDAGTGITDADIAETMETIGKLESIRRQAGYPWEYIKSIIEGTYSSMQKKTEEERKG